MKLRSKSHMRERFNKSDKSMKLPVIAHSQDGGIQQQIDSFKWEQPIEVYAHFKSICNQLIAQTEEIILLNFDKYQTSKHFQLFFDLSQLALNIIQHLADQLQTQNTSQEDSLLIALINQSLDEDTSQYQSTLHLLQTHAAQSLLKKRRLHSFISAVHSNQLKIANIKAQQHDYTLEFTTLQAENQKLLAQIKSLTEIKPKQKQPIDNLFDLSYPQLYSGLDQYISHIASQQQTSKQRLEQELRKIHEAISGHYTKIYDDLHSKLDSMESQVASLKEELEGKSKMVDRLKAQVEKLQLKPITEDKFTQINIDIPIIQQSVKFKRRQDLRLLQLDFQQNGFYDEDEVSSPFKFTLTCTVSMINLVMQDYFFMQMKRYSKNNIYQVPTSKYLSKSMMTVTQYKRNHKPKLHSMPFGQWAKFWFLRKFGQKMIAKVFYQNFINSLEYYYKATPRIKTFVELLGLRPQAESQEKNTQSRPTVQTTTSLSFTDSDIKLKKLTFQKLAPGAVSLISLAENTYFQSQHCLMNFFRTCIYFKQQMQDEAAFYMLSPFLPNAFYDTENQLPFKKIWDYLPTMFPNQQIEQEFDTYALSQMRLQQPNMQVKDSELYLKATAKDYQQIQNVSFDVVAQFIGRELCRERSQYIVKLFTSVLLKLRVQQLEQQTSNVSFSMFLASLQVQGRNREQLLNQAKELFVTFHRKIDLSRLQLIGEGQLRVELRVFDIGQDEQLQLVSNYVEFIHEVLGRVYENKEQLVEFYGSVSQKQFLKQAKKGPLGIGREGENEQIKELSIEQLFSDHVSMWIVSDELVEQMKNLVERNGLEEKSKEIKKVLASVNYSFRKSLQSYGVQSLNNLQMRARDVETGQKVWRMLKELADQLIQK